MRRLLAIAFFITFALAGTARGAAVIIGCFCMDGVDIVADGDPSPVIDGVWTPRKYTKRAGREARLFLFDGVVPPSLLLENCDQVAARAANEGRRLRLAGRLNRLALYASTFVASAGGSNRFQIDPNRIDAEIGRVISGEHTIAGGTMDLRGARLWITNPTTLLATANTIDGVLQVEAWNRTLENARLILPGQTGLTTTLKPLDPDKTNVFIRLDLQTGEARLWKGRFTGTAPAQVSAESLGAGAIELERPVMTIGNVTAAAEQGRVDVSLGTLAGRAERGHLKRTAVATLLEAPAFRIATLTGEALQSGEALTMAKSAIANAVFNASTLDVRESAGDDVLVSGPAELRVHTLTTTGIEATAKWSAPKLPTMTFLLPADALTGAEAVISGSLDAPRVSGKVGTQQVSLGGVSLQHVLDLTFDVLNAASDIRVPVKFRFGPVASGFTLRDHSKEVAVIAAARNADLEGTLVVSLSDLAESRLDVDADRFHLTLDNTVATRPLLAGSKPEFGQLGLTVTNPGPLRVGRTSSGLLTMTTDVLVLGGPILRIGEKGDASQARLRIEANGSATLRYDLANGKVGLRKARLGARNLELTLVDPNAKLDLSGTLVTSPSVRFAELGIEIDEEQQPPVGNGFVRDVAIGAARVSRPPDPANPKGVAFDGVPEGPFTIDRLEARSADVEDDISLDSLTVRGLKFALREGAAVFGDGFRIDRASLSLRADAIVSESNGWDTQETFDKAAFVVNGRLSPGQALHVNNDPSFRIEINVSGPEDALTGDGSAWVDAFTGSAQSRMAIDFQCRDSDKLYVPLEYNFGIGGTSLQVRAVNGHFGAIGETGPLALLVHTKSSSQCNSPTTKHVIAEAQEGWTEGVCFRCCAPPEAYGCKWKWTTPEVSFKYNIKLEVHVAITTVTMTNPVVRFEGQKLRVCNRGAITVLPGAFVGGYSPQIESNVPGADQIVNTILSTGFVAAQSLVGTAVLNGAGFTATVGGTVFGNLQCLN